MTTIVYCRGVIAADKRGTRDGTIDGGCVKIGRRPHDGALIALAGSAPVGAGFMRWFLAGEKPGEMPKLLVEGSKATMLIVRPDGSLEEHDESGWSPIVGVPFYAMGSGRDAALGALEMGASAELAVEIASRIDSGTGNGVDVLRLGQLQQAAA